MLGPEGGWLAPGPQVTRVSFFVFNHNGGVLYMILRDLPPSYFPLPASAPSGQCHLN